MFFISWGSRVYRRVFGEPEVHQCDICREQRTFRTLVAYKVYHIWWVFRWVVEKEFARVCTVCGNGKRVDEMDVVPKGTKSPIPFIDRMGWSIGAGGFAALIAMGTVASATQSSREADWLSHPAVNDVYEVNLAKLMQKPEANEMYSALEVVRVADGTVDVRLPKIYFNRPNGISNAVRDGRATRADFYDDSKVLRLKFAALQKMHDNGTILSVDR
jgi:hypothetical protein